MRNLSISALLLLFCCTAAIGQTDTDQRHAELESEWAERKTALENAIGAKNRADDLYQQLILAVYNYGKLIDAHAPEEKKRAASDRMHEIGDQFKLASDAFGEAVRQAEIVFGISDGEPRDVTHEANNGWVIQEFQYAPDSDSQEAYVNIDTYQSDESMSPVLPLSDSLSQTDCAEGYIIGRSKESGAWECQYDVASVESRWGDDPKMLVQENDATIKWLMYALYLCLAILIVNLIKNLAVEIKRGV